MHPAGADRPEEPTAAPVSLAVGVYLFYLFLMASRATEVFPIPNLMLLAGLTGLVAAVFTVLGRELMFSRLVYLFGALIGLTLASVLFAEWRGGAVSELYIWTPRLLLFLTGMLVLVNVKSAFRVMYALALSAAFVAVMTLLYGHTSRGRLSLDVATTIGNSNDLATALLFGAPCCMFVSATAGNKMVKLLAGACFLLCLYLAAQTGSRAGLLAMAAMAGAFFLGLPINKKVAFAAVLALLAVGLYLTLPTAVRARLVTMTHEPVKQELAGGDTEVFEEVAASSASAKLRQLMFSESIRLTVENPLLGVGLGQSASMIFQRLLETEKRKLWLQTHNSYTQVSSELGIPAFIIYMAMLFHCFRTLGAVRRKAAGVLEWQRVGRLAECIRLSLIGYCVTSMFTSIAYNYYLPVLAALVVALDRWLTAQGRLQWTAPALRIQ